MVTKDELLKAICELCDADDNYFYACEVEYEDREYVMDMQEKFDKKLKDLFKLMPREVWQAYLDDKYEDRRNHEV